MRKAIIDLGTNTFNLLIADITGKSIQVLHSEKEGVALGLGGINENIISQDAFQRGIKAIKYFKKICFALKVESILAFGTSALRNAENSHEFVQAVLNTTGIQIQIIDGEKEARLIHAGVRAGIKINEDAVIMDIGGGSTEFIFTSGKSIRDLYSLEIGVSRIYQKFEFHDPFKDSDIRIIKNYLDLQTAGKFDNHQEKILIGASGSFETFYELAYKTIFPDKMNAVKVDFDLFMETLDEMMYSSLFDRQKNPLIIPIRKIMGPIAAVKIKWFIEKVGIEKIFISPGSLKEGALLEGSSEDSKN